MTPEPASVVVVDDAADVRLLVATTLELSRRFVIVGQASNGLEAIAAAERLHPEVMLLDVSMPVMDGFEALPRVLEVSPETRVIMYSGFDNQGLAGRAQELGASAFLEKSMSIRQLPADVADVLGHAGWTSGHTPNSSATTDVTPALDASVTSASAPAAAPATSVAIATPDDLEQHRERFREVFEEAAIGMGTITLAGRLVRGNRALAKLVGRKPQDLIGVRYTELTTDLGAEYVHELVDSFSIGSDIAQLEHTVLVDGVTRRLSATVSPVRDKAKKLLYLFLQVQDVTAQRAVEDELRLSEERFRLLVDSVTDYAIVMLDTNGVVISWNAGAERTKGYRADEIIGRHFAVFYPADKQAAHQPEHELEQARRDGRYECDGWRVRRDGTHFWGNTVITAVRNDLGELIGFAQVTRDVTEPRAMVVDREAAARALSVANAKLKLSNTRLAAAVADQAQFVAVTIHELRNPLSVVTGAAEMLVDHAHQLTPEQQADMVSSMQHSAGRLNRLLADLLTSSRLESRAMDVTVARVDIAELLGQVAIAAAQTWPEHPVTVNSEPGLSVDGDSDRLAQAVDNLVINALRHGAAPVELTATGDDTAVEIRVRDSGPGVAPELRPRLFERFATGREAGGTGLGLFIVRELARAHGGDAWYEATRADGSPTSCFVMSVPRHTKRPESA